MKQRMSGFIWNIIQRLAMLLMWTFPGPAEHKYLKIEIRCKTYTWTTTIEPGQRLS